MLGEDEHPAVAVGCQDADAPHVTVKHSLFLGFQVQETDVAATHVAYGFVVHKLQTTRTLYPAGWRVKKQTHTQLLVPL